PRRNAVGVWHHLAHAGAGIADRAPDARALGHLALILRIGLVLRTLEIVESLPARLRAAEGLPIEFDVEPLGGQGALLMGAALVKPAPFRRDADGSKAFSHGDSSWNCVCGVRPRPALRASARSHGRLPRKQEPAEAMEDQVDSEKKSYNPEPGR